MTRSIKILSTRSYEKMPWFQIVYEWENILCEKINNCRVHPIGIIARILDKFFERTSFEWQNLFSDKNIYIRYEMAALKHQTSYNRNNVIPIVIDYLLKDDELSLFEKAHSNNPGVIITSREAYDKLKTLNCKLKIYHWPLSMPDQYLYENGVVYEKKYDIAINGRQNPLFNKYFAQYLESHPDLTYVKSGKRRFDFIDNNGNNIGYFESREDYIKLLRMTRIALYSTPAIDGSRPDANGFNQVTPKFLEYLTSQCYMILRYPDNSDVSYYELKSFNESVESYNDFENFMDVARTAKVDTKFYRDYLRKHITSALVPQLVNIIDSICKK